MFTVSVSGVLLLFLIHHSTLKSVDGRNIDVNTLARIITFFEQNYKRFHRNGNELQYAVAINVLTEQCRNGFQQDNFLTNENARVVRMTISNNEDPVYEGTELIAAGIQRMYGYSLHSEYLLLNPTSLHPTTPMQTLLNLRNNSCTILYSLNSPCADLCLDRYHIFDGLRTWSEHSSIKALVFKHVWRDDEINPQCLKNALKEITKYVPLYRCRNDIECFDCEDPYGEIDFRCLINNY
ncbi:uncharacterized protein LOC130564861 [Triplophysa rosa]|uniref:Uncharacterized protein n=1 Tax=Triplophysa rosa TaxID=992332 RepID=A0A9W7TNL7_TRIRA|nr:uncharacterized protein LOC130564861 [Triplophysa rosa]KAI7800465.1 hypothetical protein IRJ41_003830 [Triplophysa rosa]